MKKTLLCMICVAMVFPTLIVGQIQWQTTHDGTSSGDCQLASNTIKMTVNPLYVDVEEEAVITAIGDVGWGDPATLEIIGNFSLSKGAALRSMLLWNNTKLLKAKLRDRAAADSAYEATVDRSKPQVFARDPAEITYLGNDQYHFRIYPVAINGSRKLRILYSVPLHMFLQGPQFQILTAFTLGSYYSPTQIPVEIHKSSSTSGTYILNYGDSKKTLQFGATYQIPITAFSADSYNDWGYFLGTTAKPLCISPDTGFSAIAYTVSVGSGKTAGNYTAVFATPPDTVIAALKELSGDSSGYPCTIEAEVIAGNKAYITDFPEKGYLGVYMKSNTAWDSTIHWTVYDATGKIALQCRKYYKPHSDSLTKSMLPLIWGAKYSLVEGNDNLGALFGFVDRRMSLLALESDTMSSAEAAQWADGGVPQLKAEEIILSASSWPIAPHDNVIFEFGASAIKNFLKRSLAALTVLLKANHLITIKIADFKSGNIKVMLFNVSGKVLQTWNNVRVNEGVTELSLPLQARGCMILRVYAGKEMVQKKINVLR
jgi:hypothetical protein